MIEILIIRVGVLIVVLLALGIVTLKGLTDRRKLSRKQTKRREILTQFGFSPEEDPSDALRYYFERLYSKFTLSPMQPSLRNFFHKRLKNADVYIYDVIPFRTEDDPEPNHEGVACVSPALCLPRFWLSPKQSPHRPMPAHDSFMRLYAHTVSLPEFPGFMAEYTLFVTDDQNEEEVKNLFTSATVEHVMHANTRYELVGGATPLRRFPP
jgi:hypothetical protein